MVCLCHNLMSQNTTSYSDDNDGRNVFRSVLIGKDAGTISSQRSIVIGHEAGMNNPSSYVTLIGNDAGKDGDSQTSIFIGTGAGQDAINGQTNVGIGTWTGQNMDGAEGNLMFGFEAGKGNHGDNNILIGFRSGRNNRGDDNVYIGENAGSSSGDNNKNVYIGTKAGSSNSGSGNVFIGNEAANLRTGLNNKLYIENSADDPLIYGDFSIDKVGINTKNLPSEIGGVNISNYSLYVQGGLLSDEVRVRTSWADYVFKEDYQLKSISELEYFIDEFGHLPNCPSEEDVLEQGIEIGDISRVQQEKIEELTLYIIQQEKSINSLHSDMENLKVQLKQLLEIKTNY